MDLLFYTEYMKPTGFLSSLNVINKCKELRVVSIWQCPHFLFIVMGFVIAVAITSTHIVAAKYTEPEISVLIVVAVTVILFIIGHAVVSSFEKVAEASKLKSDFISIISHELRNPLSSIKWHLNILQDERIRSSPDELHRTMVKISEQNERMIRLINDLLDVNRIEDRMLGLSPSDFSLNEVSNDMIKQFESLAKGANLQILLLSAKNELVVKADKEKIKSVMARLIDNAIQYSSSAGDVIVTLEDLGTAVRWSVTDQGVGVPTEQIRGIFSKFFRASNILRYQTEGLGIGLYISRYIIEASGGKIGFHTLEGKGSTFYFTLPKIG